MAADVGSSDAGVEGFRFREMVPAGLFFLSATVLYTYPFVFHLPGAVMIGGGDYLGEASLVAWNAHQLLQNPSGLLDTQFFYPHSGSTAYGQSLFFPGLVAAPALALTPRPLLVTNALMLLALVLSGLFMYMLARSLAAGVFPSLLAGVVFAFFPNRMDHLGQFTVQMGLFLPLAVWAFYRVLFWRRWVDLFLLIGAIWAQTLSSMYYTFALGFLLAGLFVACVCLRPRLLSRALLLKGAVGCLLLIAALAPFLKPYVDLHRELGLQRDVGDAEWHRRSGRAAAMVDVLNRTFGQMGVRRYVVAVYSSNAHAQVFYRRLGFRSVGGFSLYERAWVRLELDLSTTAGRLRSQANAKHPARGPEA